MHIVVRWRPGMFIEGLPRFPDESFLRVGLSGPLCNRCAHLVPRPWCGWEVRASEVRFLCRRQNPRRWRTTFRYVPLRAWRAMKEERLVCPTTPKRSHVTERCLKTKLQIYTTPRNGTYLLLAAVG